MLILEAFLRTLTVGRFLFVLLFCGLVKPTLFPKQSSSVGPSFFPRIYVNDYIYLVGDLSLGLGDS